ncbi:MAG TPA: hypothetical protein VFW94_18380 [Candidatus Acidoferrales bacterium]|nr:hypothetical protein [Candidatus Acidoferrales bacterium]
MFDGKEADSGRAGRAIAIVLITMEAAFEVRSPLFLFEANS